MGAQSVSLIKPNFRESFSTSNAPVVVAGSDGGVVGTSVGAVLAGAWAAGVSVDEVVEVGLSLHEMSVKAVRAKRMGLLVMMMASRLGMVPIT